MSNLPGARCRSFAVGLAVALAALAGAPGPSSAQAKEPLPDWLRSKNADVERGNERFAAGDFAGAVAAYDEAARALPGDNGVHLNRGLALLRSGDIEGAQAALQLANRPGEAGSQGVRASAYRALGQSAYAQGDAAAGDGDHQGAQQHFQSAVDSLKQSLRLQPGSPEAAWNLELALRRLREETQKAEQEQQDQDKQDQDKQDQDKQDQDQQGQDQQDQDQQGQDKQDQQEQDQQKQDQQKQDKQKQDKQKQDQQKQDQQKQDKPLPTDVRQALDALQDGEDNLERHRARQRAARERRKPAKDW